MATNTSRYTFTNGSETLEGFYGEVTAYEGADEHWTVVDEGSRYEFLVPKAEVLGNTGPPNVNLDDSLVNGQMVLFDYACFPGTSEQNNFMHVSAVIIDTDGNSNWTKVSSEPVLQDQLHPNED